MKNIAILLTVHNRKANTLQCLAQVYNCILPEDCSFEVFLVDDGCTDDTSDAVYSEFPLVNIIQGNGNLYWNRGMHLAWETAAKTKDYDYYLWLNDDTFIYSNAIYEILECSKILDNKSIICGVTCSANNENKVTYGGQKLKIGLLPPNGNLQICEFFNGNFVLVPKYVFNRVGNLDFAFHHSIGDIDYGVRAIKKNINIYTTRMFIGTCELHDKISKWRSPDEPLIMRLKALYSPLGCNPFQFFIFDFRQNNMLTAIKHFITIHLRTVFP